MISTGGIFAPSILVTSPSWMTSGKWCFVTASGNFSISLDHIGFTPLCTAARHHPPIPSNRLPNVSIPQSPELLTSQTPDTHRLHSQATNILIVLCSNLLNFQIKKISWDIIIRNVQNLAGLHNLRLFKRNLTV